MTGGVTLTKAQAVQVRKTEELARLLSKTTEDARGCWLWGGSLNTDGYGFVRWEGRTQKVHRLAYRLWCGPIPPGLFVCHHCDVPRCTNPRHLFLGTPGDNMRDMVRKGRARSQITSAQDHWKNGHAPRGSMSGGAKLNDEQVIEIMAKRENGATTRQLADAYGLEITAIQRLVRGKTWSHLTGLAALKAQPMEGEV
jgi:hypothetical protein